MIKQYRTDITATEGSRRLDRFWSDHWGGLDITALAHGLERTELWRLFKRWIPETGRVLEAGCGPGHWVKFLSEQGYRAVGLDLAERALRSSKQTVPSLNVTVGDLTVTPFPSQHFDAYVSLGVIEHFEEGPGDILAEALRVVKPGGTLIFTVPFMSWVKRAKNWRHRLSSDAVDKNEQVFYQYVMSGGELRSLLTRAGFEVISVRCIEVEGGLQNRVPSVGVLKDKIRANPNPLLQRAIPALHAGWDFFIKMLPAPALAHMVMAVCRRPSE